MTHKRIIWLASYPKSGNTWLRIFLENLLKEGNEPIDINSLDRIAHAAGRFLLDSHFGVEMSDLSEDEVEHYRPDIYESIAANSKENVFLKVHDAYTLNKSGKPIFSTNATLGAIYLIRNPLDITVSYAHHESKDINYMIRKMADQRATMNRLEGRIIGNIRQRLLTWSQHVKSWVDIKDFPVHIVRYEDMLQNTMETFEKTVRFTHLQFDKNQIEKAVENSRFELLQKQEQGYGFREKRSEDDSFFREGRIGQWKENLNKHQIKQVIKEHKEIMIRFGYLGPDD